MKIITLKGQIKLLTGLHIGGGDDTMKIGGVDNQVIKDVYGKPYIPGSSIKGKMRSLLEHHYDLVYLDGAKGDPFSSKFLDQAKDRKKAENLLKLFGDSAQNNTSGITRISIGDCSLSEDSKGKKLSEAKYENVIDRKSGTASNPRQTERVPKDIKFEFDIRVKVIEGDDESSFKRIVEEGLTLIQNDYLGGSGSRGYGRVEFINEPWS